MRRIIHARTSSWRDSRLSVKLTCMFARYANLTVLVIASMLLAGVLLLSQSRQTPAATGDQTRTEVSAASTSDAIAKLNQKLTDGQVRLSSNGATGYLRSVLAALDISVNSQVLVYSETSLQS